MTTITPVALFEGTAVTTSPVAVYTSPAATKTSIQSLSFVNASGSGAVVLTVYAVPSGGSANAASAAISAQSLAVNASYQCPELVNQILEAGDAIQVKASASGIVGRGSGAQIV